MKKRILFLLHTPPPVHGSSIVGLSIKESEIINDAFKCCYINLLASQNVAESGQINFRKIFYFLVTWIKVFVAIIKTKPNLCYLALTATGPAFLKDLLLVALLKLFRIKRIYHLHNKGVSLHQHKILYKLGYDFVFRNADVILLSKLLYPDIKFFVHESKIHICPNGSHDLGLRTLINLSSKKNNSKNLKNPAQILFLSNLIESKGVNILLEACSLLKDKNISFKCIYVGGEGDIKTSDFKEHIQQLQLDNEVSYQGPKYEKDKLNAFRDSDIFVFPTYYETFGLVILEAMQQSKPVISTFEGGIPDIIEDGVTGFLLPQKDAYSLADKLEILIKNSDLRLQMGEAGRLKYENEFTLPIFESRLKSILDNVIS